MCANVYLSLRICPAELRLWLLYCPAAPILSEIVPGTRRANFVPHVVCYPEYSVQSMILWYLSKSEISFQNFLVVSSKLSKYKFNYTHEMLEYCNYSNNSTHMGKYIRNIYCMSKYMKYILFTKMGYIRQNIFVIYSNALQIYFSSQCILKNVIHWKKCVIMKVVALYKKFIFF